MTTAGNLPPDRRCSFLGGRWGVSWIAAILGTGLVVPIALEAHRLDEYLQATLISIAPNRLRLQLSLTPGIEILPGLLPTIDRNLDGAISSSEARAYTKQILKDLVLTVDQRPLKLILFESVFPAVSEMRDGLGTIQLDLTAEARWLRPGLHQISFQNRHQTNLSQYTVNILMPATNQVRVLSQNRDALQRGIIVQYQSFASGEGRSLR
jgi:hypothetical protein